MYREQPESIENFIQCVKTFAATYGSLVIKQISAKVVKRAKLCLDTNGGHFQHLIKKVSEILLCLSLLTIAIIKMKSAFFLLLNKTQVLIIIILKLIIFDVSKIQNKKKITL